MLTGSVLESCALHNGPGLLENLGGQEDVATAVVGLVTRRLGLELSK